MSSTTRARIFAAVALFAAACAEEGKRAPIPAVDSGELKLVVEPSPWRMRFQDADGHDVLVENGATGGGPTGSLALHLGPPPEGDGSHSELTAITEGDPAAPVDRDSGWVHATRLESSRVEGDTWIGTVATTDRSRKIEVRASPSGAATIEVRATALSPDGVQAIGIGFDSPGDERLVGFGERSNGVDQSGNVLEHYVGEGPYQDADYALLGTLVPPWGIRWRKDATYYPMPWLLSSRGVGVLVDNDELSYHRLKTSAATAWSTEVESTELRFRVFGGPRPADVLMRFSAAVGRQLGTDAPWFYGTWVQPDDDSRIDALRTADVPTSVTATFLHYLPCGAQQGAEQAQIDRTTALHAKGTAVHTYFNPMICQSYAKAFDPASALGGLIRDRNGQTYVFPYRTTTTFQVSEFDFSSSAGVAAYAALAREAIDHGYEGWMEDFGEYTPLDARSSDGITGTRFHNRYARDYHCGVRDATQDAGKPLARFVRSGWTGSAACSPIVWGGDPTTSFGFDGLESSIYQALSMGTSGVGVWGSDIGGFFALLDSRLSDELLDRWIAFGGLSVVMRNEKDGIAVPSKSRPQIWDPAHLPIWRRYAKLHTQLYPYIKAAVDQYRATGMPVMRHHVLTHPDDAEAVKHDDQYMFGPDLLVAPVYVQGATERTVYLPAGQWVDFWRSVTYDEATGTFDRSTTREVIEGGRTVTVSAPIEEIPLFVRAGATIPMLPADVDTLTDHGDPGAIVHLSDRQGQVRTLAF